MTLELKITALTDQTTQLLDVFSQLPIIITDSVNVHLETNERVISSVAESLINTPAQTVLTATNKSPIT